MTGSATVLLAVDFYWNFSQNINVADTSFSVHGYQVELSEWTSMTMVNISHGMEFAMAQTPNRMRGIMMGLMIAMSAWSSIGSTLITSIMRIFKASEQKYILYSCLALPPLAMLMLIILLIAAKRYKLRERERHVNIQAIAEEHYERYFDQEEEYMREVADMYKNYSYN